MAEKALIRPSLIANSCFYQMDDGRKREKRATGRKSIFLNLRFKCGEFILIFTAKYAEINGGLYIS